MKLSDIKSGETLPGDCGNPDDLPPIWLDRERFFRGQAFFRRHSIPLTMAMHCSLACGLAVPNLLEALVFTEESDTPVKSLKRYMTTFLYLALWHINDIWDDPGCKGFKTIRRVRAMHKAVFNEMNNPIRADSEALYVSQYDMALVQYGFVWTMVMYPSVFGVKCSQEELEDYVHFWRGIGYLLGMSDNFNICSGNYSETFQICKEIQSSVILPCMKCPPQDFNRMARAYCEGINLFLRLPFCSIEAIFAFVYDGMDLPLPKLKWADWFRFWCMKMLVFCIRWIPMFDRAVHFFVIKIYNKQLQQTISVPKNKSD